MNQELSVAPKVFKKGERVYITSLGETGRVSYVRFRAPQYSTPDAYSIMLDSRMDDPYYSGSVFAAEDVVKL